MLINIRGTSGSGKSTLVQQVMRQFGPAQPLVDKTMTTKGKVKYKTTGYMLQGTIYIPGRYETACGGCDTIKTQDEVEERVRTGHQRAKHVIWEGLLVCSSYGRWAKLDDEIGPTQWIFLNTPFEQCLENILKRRKESGNDKPHDQRSIENCRFKYDTNLKVLEKCRADNRSAHHLDSNDALELIRGWVSG